MIFGDEEVIRRGGTKIVFERKGFFIFICGVEIVLKIEVRVYCSFEVIVDVVFVGRLLFF